MKSFCDEWAPLKEVRKLFNYKTTQMAVLLKNKILVVVKIASRVFVVK